MVIDLFGYVFIYLCIYLFMFLDFSGGYEMPLLLLQEVSQ